MKQILITIALAVFAFLMMLFPAKGQNSKESLLWEISGNDLDKPSYLFGTIHLLCPEDLMLGDKITTALNNSEQLVLELDLSDRSVLREVQQKMMYQDGTTAKDYLSPEEYGIVKQFFSDSLQMPFERLHSIKPFFLTSMTYPLFLGCQPASWEMQLMQQANKHKKQVMGLETAEEQIAVIESLPLELRKNMLLESITDYEAIKNLFGEMLTHYLNEDIKGLQALTEEYMSDKYAAMEEKLLNKRNHNWIKDITRISKEKPAFFAVGAAHLGGKNGVITLLKEKGYTLRPVH
jgi:uncharacterized protein YbaP (TraB family)